MVNVCVPVVVNARGGLGFQLEHLVHYLPELGVHPDFLLWLTLEPTAVIPSSILRAGVKLRDVAPHGIKAKLLESFRSMPASVLDESSAPRTWKRLLLGLVLFHAIVQVRCGVQRRGKNRESERESGKWGDRKWPSNEAQNPHVRGVRVALGAGYYRGEGNRRTTRNSRESDLPPNTPYRNSFRVRFATLWLGSYKSIAELMYPRGLNTSFLYVPIRHRF